MKKRVKFEKGFQKKFIQDLKIKSSLGWKELANRLNVNENTLSKAYMFESCDIPYPLFKNINEIINETESNIIKTYNCIIKNEEFVIGRKVFGEQKLILKDIKIDYNSSNLNLDISPVNFSRIDLDKKIKFPIKLSPELAEEIGMHFGDGFLSNKRFTYRLKGNIKDEKEYYIDYIRPLFKRLYNIDVNLKEFDSVFGFEIYSQALCEFKIKVLGIKSGNKQELFIPEKLKVNNVKIICSFIRGLFDTDGCLSFQTKYNHEKYYPVIELTLYSKKVIEEVFNMLRILGFKPGLYKERNKLKIKINGIQSLKKYEKLIGWSSQKNLNKVKDWKNRYPELYRD